VIDDVTFDGETVVMTFANLSGISEQRCSLGYILCAPIVMNDACSDFINFKILHLVFPHTQIMCMCVRKFI
jgi:hypothetical protein